MSSPLQWIVIGFVVLVCVELGVGGVRKRRQNFFFFPGDDDRFGNRGDFDFSNGNQFVAPQPQRRVPFPTPIQPGPPAIIDSPQTPTPTVIPHTVVTTASPAFFACMQNCPTTSEYNPICGTNRQLYHNKQKFDCAIRCGARAEIWRRGSCQGLFPMSRG